MSLAFSLPIFAPVCCGLIVYLISFHPKTRREVGKDYFRVARNYCSKMNHNQENNMISRRTTYVGTNLVANLLIFGFNRPKHKN